MKRAFRVYCVHNQKFDIPWSMNHCGPIAIAHVSDGDRDTALRVAEYAREQGLLSRSGAARMIRVEDVLDRVWLRPVGYRVARVDVFGRGEINVAYRFGGRRNDPQRGYRTGRLVSTLLRQREWQRGRWLVFVRNHVFALVDGEARGTYWPGQRVQKIIKVEPVPARA